MYDWDTVQITESFIIGDRTFISTKRIIIDHRE